MDMTDEKVKNKTYRQRRKLEEEEEGGGKSNRRGEPGRNSQPRSLRP